MRLWHKIGIVALGVFIAIPAIVAGGLQLWVRYSTYPSDISDFRPVTFSEKSDAPFFYSIGDELKYSTSIDTQAISLLKGNIKQVLVAPDNSKAAVIADSVLFVVAGDGSLNRKVTSVASIYREPKPVGEQFVRDDNFRWSRDSRFLYFIKDEYYASKGSQLFSERGELWIHNTATWESKKILAPFRAYTYFLGAKGGVYFSEPDGKGNLALKHFDGANVHELGTINRNEFDRSSLADGETESLFYSFSSPLDYERGVLARNGVLLKQDQDKSQRLAIGGKDILAVSLGQGIKGPYHCLNLLRSVFLPGDQFFLLNTPCGNYSGQLLIDLSTGSYKTLPKDTRIYPRMNTDAFAHYRFTGSGVELKQ